MSRRRGIPGLSFSWRRALGVSQAQARLSRKIGLPLSRSGRQRKAGRVMGCALPLVVLTGAGLPHPFHLHRRQHRPFCSSPWPTPPRTPPW